jgi:hypothetical protein
LRQVSRASASLLVANFPAALAAVLDWLQPIEHTDFVVNTLHESGLPERFPEAALRLLDRVIDDQPWAPRELTQCLIVISQASPALLQDQRYQRLDEYSRRHES